MVVAFVGVRGQGFGFRALFGVGSVFSVGIRLSLG